MREEISFFFKFLLAIYFPLCLTLLVPALCARTIYTPKAMNSKAEITYDWLRERGWTISSAARRLKLHPSHVNRVLSGKRKSAKLMKQLAALPKQTSTLAILSTH